MTLPCHCHVCRVCLGEEVVLKTVEMREINCIAGVLKLYFRELREPLFPLQLFDELISCIRPDQTGGLL